MCTAVTLVLPPVQTKQGLVAISQLQCCIMAECDGPLLSQFSEHPACALVGASCFLGACVALLVGQCVV